MVISPPSRITIHGMPCYFRLSHDRYGPPMRPSLYVLGFNLEAQERAASFRPIETAGEGEYIHCRGTQGHSSARRVIRYFDAGSARRRPARHCASSRGVWSLRGPVVDHIQSSIRMIEDREHHENNAQHDLSAYAEQTGASLKDATEWTSAREV